DRPGHAGHDRMGGRPCREGALARAGCRSHHRLGRPGAARPESGAGGLRDLQALRRRQPPRGAGGPRRRGPSAPDLVSLRLRGLCLAGLAVLPLLAVPLRIVPVEWAQRSGGHLPADPTGLALILGATLVVGWVATELLFGRDARRLRRFLGARSGGRSPAT